MKHYSMHYIGRSTFFIGGGPNVQFQISVPWNFFLREISRHRCYKIGQRKLQCNASLFVEKMFQFYFYKLFMFSSPWIKIFFKVVSHSRVLFEHFPRMKCCSFSPSSFVDMHRCPSRVSADGSLREFGFEFKILRIIQFVPVVHTIIT